MVRRALAVAVGLLFVACAHAPPRSSWSIASASTPDTFEIGGTGHDWAVKVSEEQISSAWSQISGSPGPRVRSAAAR